MVSLTYHDEHVAWQQRVQKEITQAHRFQVSESDGFKKTISPPKRHNRSSHKRRAHSTVYSNLPAANVNLAAMNVYAEVRGKYARNANNTINNPTAPGILSRPSTSGSLMSYRRPAYNDEPKKVQVEEEPKKERPLNNEAKIIVKKRRVREKDAKQEVGEVDRIVFDDEAKREEGGEGGEGGEVEEGEDSENKEVVDENEVVEDGEEKGQDDADKKTEFSFKTTSSQKRYIEELERLLREERMKRIDAEGKLQRLSTRGSKRN